MFAVSENLHQLPFWCTVCIQTRQLISTPTCTCQGQRSTLYRSITPTFTAARVSRRSWTKSFSWWTRRLKHSQVSSPHHHHLHLQHHPSLTLLVCHPTPPLLPSVFISPFISSSSHIAMSCCQSEQGFVTPGEGCLAPVELSWALGVLFLCLCVCLEVGVWVWLKKTWAGTGMCVCIVYELVYIKGICLFACASVSVCVQEVFPAYVCISVCLHLLICLYTCVHTL